MPAPNPELQSIREEERQIERERVTEAEFHAVTALLKIHEEGNEMRDELEKLLAADAACSPDGGAR